MWKVVAVLLHLAILGFMLMIYFRSSIISGIQPQLTHRELGLKPPADRLVVFLTDGFRAESFFSNKCSSVPQLQGIFMEQGLVGIARACAPTQSRPGHIAIFGGFAETFHDPSAALTNFKKKLTVFDTVFNRTMGGTWGWGGTDIANIFRPLPDGGNPLRFETYTNLDFTGRFQADQWVFGRVQSFFANPEKVKLMNSKVPTLFYIYLGDIDVAGHAVKPNSKEYWKTVNKTLNGVVQTYKLFERIFKDKRTVYLLTSDHGMRDSGSHGGSTSDEIHVPFFFWGAGINRVGPHNGLTFAANSRGDVLPLHDLEQIQLAPLMSALIGLPPPMNNMALLPQGYMNVSVEYEAISMHLNTLQLLAQVRQIYKTQHHGILSKWLPRYQLLDGQRVARYKLKFAKAMEQQCYLSALELSRQMGKRALECLVYYRDYYHIPLLVGLAIASIGVFCFLIASQSRQPVKARNWTFLTISSAVFLSLELLVAVLLYLQHVPCWISFYFLLPLPIWWLALGAHVPGEPLMRAPIIQLLWIFAASALLVSSFFYPHCIAWVYLAAMVAHNRRGFAKPSVKFFVWLGLVVLLTACAAYGPDLGYNHPFILYFSMVLTMLRPLVLNERHAWHVWLVNGSMLLLGAYAVEQRRNNEPIDSMLHSIFWFFLCYATISIPFGNTSTPQQRQQLVLFNLSTIYTLLSLSCESIFIQIMCTEFSLGLQVHVGTKEQQSDEEDSESEQVEKPDKPLTPLQHVQKSYLCAGAILLYTYFSSIAVGNQPSITSYDPNIARIFITDYSITFIGFLIVLKILLPPLIIITTMFAFYSFARQNIRSILVCMLLICDAMGIYFFIFVRNSGNWLGVRDSVSNLFVVLGIPLGLVSLIWLPKFFLSAIPMTMLPMLRWKSVPLPTHTGQSEA
ncbi:CG13978 [Drosophila busckii]|uniref:GPI ethanolamine phosphate transferase 1 n=1 Tax=Drosophila busckii TaxID=30019 RepID=A0A0M4ERE5_DROBS|nr:GPI ethanolamine phosphate transferase 1 [Drosophila busckii]ALC47072.1 CG13978 [Drosophila busckii]